MNAHQRAEEGAGREGSIAVDFAEFDREKLLSAMGMDRPFDEMSMFVSEGVCPTHRTPLERRDDYGYCATCKLGWRLRAATDDEKWMGETVVESVVIIEPDIPDVFERNIDPEEPRHG